MKNGIKFGVLITMAIVALSSCTADEDLYDPTKAAEKIKAQYEEAFVSKFGEIASNQDWGFSVSAISRTVTKPEQPEFKDNVEVPGNVTEEERQLVNQWFTDNPNPSSVSLQWSDFIIQQVCSSSKRSSMNELQINGESVNDYNAGNAGTYAEARLIQNSSVSGFRYKNSMDGGNWHSKYTIQYINGAYYVGFDFEAHGQNANQQEEADGVYNDWILKITPANYKYAKRIMAEDLGYIGDFDFNDVVFDAIIVDNTTALITLLAAGGTLPLYIGAQDDANEVHNLFGVSTTTMVNTKPGMHQEKAPVIFRLTGYTDIQSIPIIIDNKGVISTSSAEPGKAPGKICIPNTTTDWSNETVGIEITYPKFNGYVSDPDTRWWE